MKKILLVAIFCISIFSLTACSQADILTSSSSEIPLPSDSDTIARPKFENPDLKDFTLEEIKLKNMISEDSEFMKTLISVENLSEATVPLLEKLDINDFILIGLQMGYAIEQEEMDGCSFIALVDVYNKAVKANISVQDMLSYIYNPDYSPYFKYFIMEYLFEHTMDTDLEEYEKTLDPIARQIAEDKSMPSLVRQSAAKGIMDGEYSDNLWNEIRMEN